MPEINDVTIKFIGSPSIRSVFTGLPEPIIPQSPPVTSNIGLPIVDIPGCVEYNPNGPGLLKDDSNGTYTICDANIPSFNPIQYTPNEMIMTGPPEYIPKLEDTSDSDVDELPSQLPNQVKPPVPNIPIVEENKEETVELIEEPTFVEKYLPAPEEVTTTVTIAVAAASAAVFGKPIAELLLKLIKPTVKKVINKISKIRGKKKPILSVLERRQLQRALRKE